MKGSKLKQYKINLKLKKDKKGIIHNVEYTINSYHFYVDCCDQLQSLINSEEYVINWKELVQLPFITSQFVDGILNKITPDKNYRGYCLLLAKDISHQSLIKYSEDIQNVIYNQQLDYLWGNKSKFYKYEVFNHYGRKLVEIFQCDYNFNELIKNNFTTEQITELQLKGILIERNIKVVQTNN